MGPRNSFLARALCLYSGALLVALHFTVLGSGSRGDQELAPRHGLLLRDSLPQQDADDGGGEPDGTSYSRSPEGGGNVFVTLSFQDFNRDPHTLQLQVMGNELSASEKELGYTDAGLNAVYAKYGSQGQAVYHKELLAYLQSRGFRLLNATTAMVNVPALVQRNIKRLHSAAGSLAVSIGPDGNSDQIIGAATAMVQTALAYKELPDVENGIHIGAFHEPLEVLSEGWGNCGSKTALLASILMNWDGTRVVGISLPGHYLMGIQRNPQANDVYVEYQGLEYVLIEPVGPAWLPPGTVGQDTQEKLDAMNGVPIEPFQRG